MAGEADEAVRYALRLLGYRARSERELHERLSQKGYSDFAVRSAIERMRGFGYVNDGALAESLSRRASEGKRLGLAGARRFLRQRGIAAAQTDGALEGYDEETPAMHYAKKALKSMDGLPRDVVRRRLMGRLGRRGFGADTIRKTISITLKEIEDDKKDD